MAHRFKADLEIIGINPFVQVPVAVLSALFKTAGREKGPIPVRGSVNGNMFQQTLVRYRGLWRLYINLVMLPDSPRRVGETLDISIAFDTADRSIPMPPALETALNLNPAAAAAFHELIPSRKKEIMRYIAALKSAEAIIRNVQRTIAFLNGNGRFAGRDGARE